MTAKTPSQEPEPSGWGPTSRQVAANLARLRTERGLSTTRLSAVLKALGQPIPPTGITRIEKGQRRVDADDLVALALALGVNVSALLLPPTASGTAEVTGIDHPLEAFRLWAWASGDAQLPLADDPAWDGPTENVPPAEREQRSLRWWQLCKPHRAMARPADWARHREQLNVVLSEAQKAVHGGVSIPVLVDLLEESLFEYAMFETVDGKERVVTRVGDFEFNRMASSDNWRRVPDEEVAEYLQQIEQRRQAREAGTAE